MPTKEEIEAELNADERARTVKRLQEMQQEFEVFETFLCAREDELGLPRFYRSKPWTERLAHVGVSKEIIENFQASLDAMCTIVRTGPNDLPEHIKRELAEWADAKLSAAEQLADIVRAHRKN